VVSRRIQYESLLEIFVQRIVVSKFPEEKEPVDKTKGRTESSKI